jgi:phage gp29-like protein
VSIYNLNTLISEILDCVLFGFQPLEIIWQKQGNLILPSDISAKPAEWFVFDDENKLMLKTKDNFTGEQLPERKFLCPQYNPSYQNPYGERTLSRIFWNCTLKKGGLQFWISFTEKYGMPFLVGKHPRGTSSDETENLANLMQAMVQDAIAVIPDDSSIEIQGAIKTSSADIYEKLIDKMNAEISKAILGQTLTTEVGNKGSYAASNTHMDVRGDIIETDKRIVERTLNQLIRWIYDYNFSRSSNIPVFSMYEEEDVDLTLAQRDKILSDAGVKFTKKYLMKTYGFEEDDIELAEANMPEKAQPAFKEFKESEFPDQQAIDKFIDSFSDDELQTQADTVLKPIIEMIQSANSYEEIYENLSNKGLRTNEIEKILQKVIFISETWGQINGLD